MVFIQFYSYFVSVEYKDVITLVIQLGMVSWKH
jgi:hypothetical protein